MPLASGSLYTKIYKGMKELAWLGLIEWTGTRMSGAQALGCSPIYDAWERQSYNIRPQKPDTIAKSLAIGNPADGYYALKVMEQTNGAAAAVTDDEIVDGIKLLAETEGVFAETAGGVVISGLKRTGRARPRPPGRGDGGVHHRRRTEDAGSGGARRSQPALHVRATIDSFEDELRQRDGVLPAAKAVA